MFSLMLIIKQLMLSQETTKWIANSWSTSTIPLAVVAYPAATTTKLFHTMPPMEMITTRVGRWIPVCRRSLKVPNLERCEVPHRKTHWYSLALSRMYHMRWKLCVSTTGLYLGCFWSQWWRMVTLLRCPREAQFPWEIRGALQERMNCHAIDMHDAQCCLWMFSLREEGRRVSWINSSVLNKCRLVDVENARWKEERFVCFSLVRRPSQKKC